MKRYLMAPESTWATDRYETFVYKLYHEYPTSILVEQRDTEECPESITTIVFIRDTDHCIDLDMWMTLKGAEAKGSTVRLARMDRTGQLVLVPWEQLECTVQDYAVQVGYVSVKKKAEAKA